MPKCVWGESATVLFLFFTLYAAQFSGNTFVSCVGRSYMLGFLVGGSIPFFLMIYVTYLFIAPRLYRLLRAREYITTAYFIRDRFNSP